VVAAGDLLDQLMAQLDANGLGWTFAFNGADLDAFYAELSAAAK
jgi:hypothetical protein